jgi:glyoxylate/hydroxypyruvate reductase A
MIIAFINEKIDPAPWRDVLTKEVPGLDFRVWPHEVDDPADIDIAVVALPPPGLLKTFPNLKAILSMWAGVETLLLDPDLPRDVPLGRLVDRQMTRDMTHHVVHWVLHYHRDVHRYAEQQRQGKWRSHPYPEAADRRVGIMGLGALGGAAARVLADLGFSVAGWATHPKSIEGVEAFLGDDGLIPFLERTDILVGLLPLTPATEGIINRATLAHLPKGAYIVNAGRGGSVVDDDLIAALDSGAIARASLDVFRAEPLAADHPFWRHPGVDLTPHVASHTTTRTAGREVALDIRRVAAGEKPRNLVDLDRGY